MGANKQLLPLLGRPAILHCLEALWQAGFIRPVVVLSPEGTEIAGVLADRSVTIAWNEDPVCEMADSVRTGLKSTPSTCSALLIYPADYPLVSSSTIADLGQRYESEPEKIIIPTYQGSRGHPVLFPRFMLEELDSGLTLRDVIHNHPADLLHCPVEDEAILLDMDTPADYDLMCFKAAAGIGRNPD